MNRTRTNERLYTLLVAIVLKKIIFMLGENILCLKRFEKFPNSSEKFIIFSTFIYFLLLIIKLKKQNKNKD